MSNNKRYKTPRYEQKCVKYWDRSFRTLSFWCDWTSAKVMLETHLDEIMSEMACSKNEAREIVWGAFIAASHEDDSPVDYIFQDLVIEIPEAEIPLFLCHLGIGSDIFFGHTEKEARLIYKDWMDDDPNNPIFGEYRLTKTFKVVPLET